MHYYETRFESLKHKGLLNGVSQDTTPLLSFNFEKLHADITAMRGKCENHKKKVFLLYAAPVSVQSAANVTEAACRPRGRWSSPFTMGELGVR